GKPAREARIDRDYGIVFQDPVLYDWRTVGKNIALPLEMARWPRRRRSERVQEMLGLVELTGFADHHPWQLSGGMQQRVSIARALVRPCAAADGRAVRRTRRDDARADEHGAAPDLGAEPLDDRLRHALDRRGRLPLDARRGHVGPAGPDLRAGLGRSPAAAHRGHARAAALLRARDAGT